MEKQLGQTKDAGFQFGIRRTLPISAEEAWNFLFSDSGLKIWLGKLKNELEIQKEYETENGITGLVRVYNPYSNIRLSWKQKKWKNISTVQIRVIAKQETTTIAIHQEKLLDAVQRSEMKQYWTKIIKKIEAEIE